MVLPMRYVKIFTIFVFKKDAKQNSSIYFSKDGGIVSVTALWSKRVFGIFFRFYIYDLGLSFLFCHFVRHNNENCNSLIYRQYVALS